MKGIIVGLMTLVFGFSNVAVAEQGVREISHREQLLMSLDAQSETLSRMQRILFENKHYEHRVTASSLNVAISSMMLMFVQKYHLNHTATKERAVALKEMKTRISTYDAQLREAMKLGNKEFGPKSARDWKYRASVRNGIKMETTVKAENKIYRRGLYWRLPIMTLGLVGIYSVIDNTSKTLSSEKLEEVIAAMERAQVEIDNTRADLRALPQVGVAPKAASGN